MHQAAFFPSDITRNILWASNLDRKGTEVGTGPRRITSEWNEDGNPVPATSGSDVARQTEASNSRDKQWLHEGLRPTTQRNTPYTIKRTRHQSLRSDTREEHFGRSFVKTLINIQELRAAVYQLLQLNPVLCNSVTSVRGCKHFALSLRAFEYTGEQKRKDLFFLQ